MDWALILSIIVPLGALAAWGIKRLDKKFEYVGEQLLEIKRDIRSIDQRLSRLEGAFDERGRWESHLKTKK